MKKEKGEISVSMIVGIVIIVLTFGIIAIVYSQLITSVEIDREVCKQSALLKSSMPDGLITGQMHDLISLKCKTKKICVTSKSIIQGKGDCSEMLGEDFTTYRIKRDTADQQIKTLLAREMADCWEMLGRGNIPIFERAMKTDTKIGSVAVICSKIHFDKTITESEGLNIQEIYGMNRYLLSHKVPNYDLSYWDFLTNAYDGETLQLLYGERVKSTDAEISVTNFLDEKLDLTKTKTIFFVESRPTAKGAIFGSVIGAGIGLIGGGILVGPGIATQSAILGGYTGFKLGDWFYLRGLREEGQFVQGTYASSTFLTDYSLEGFKEFKNSEEGSFEIASYA